MTGKRERERERESGADECEDGERVLLVAREGDNVLQIFLQLRLPPVLREPYGDAPGENTGGPVPIQSSQVQGLGFIVLTTHTLSAAAPFPHRL